MKNNEHRLPSEILESRPELTETQNGVLKGLIGIIPHVGTMINEIFFEIPNRIQQYRINETVEILKQKFSQLEDKVLLTDYLLSDDFFDFTRNMFENSLRIKSEDKRKTLANIYVNSFTNSADYDISNFRLFMDFIVQLSPIQIHILKFIEENESNLSQISSYSNFFDLYTKADGSYKMDRYKFKFFCNDLENKALVSFGAGLEDFKSTSKLLALEEHIEPSVTMTSFGIDFIKYLNE